MNHLVDFNCHIQLPLFIQLKVETSGLMKNHVQTGISGLKSTGNFLEIRVSNTRKPRISRETV